MGVQFHFRDFIRRAEHDLPVSTGDIKFLWARGGTWQGLMLITMTDRIWNMSAQNIWRDGGQFPGSPINVDRETWGATKGKFR